MSFNLKGFAGGLADAGTTYIKGVQSDRKDSKDATRSLMFNATENMYNTAKETKKANDAQRALDKKYISSVKSIDSGISKDNLNKLLSLPEDKRKQAEDEFYYRQLEDPNVTFGDFMSLVDEAEDLENPALLDNKMQQTNVQKPTKATAFYDKSGLVPDYMIDDIYSEVTGIMTAAFGYGPEKARKIVDDGLYQIEHPPIKINWSKKLYLTKNEITLAAQQIHANELNVTKLKIDVTTNQVEQTRLAEESIKSKWLSTYQIPVKKDGEVVMIDGKPQMRIIPTEMVGVHPGLDADFRNSPAYMQHVKDSTSAKIALMQQDPNKFKEGTMAYLNTAFPGMYGGTIEAAQIDGPQYEDFVSNINPTQVFYVQQQTADEAGEVTNGYVKTGAEIIAVWKNKYSKAEEMNAGNNYVGETSEDSNSVPDPINDADKARLADARNQITRAQQLLKTARETNETPEVIESLSKQVTATEVEAEELAQEIKIEEQKAATDAEFKALRAKRKNAPKVFKGDQYTANGNQQDLELAIEQRDKSKIQIVIDNIDKLMEENPSTVKQQQMMGVGIPLPGNKNYDLSETKSEALAALDNMEELLEQDIVEGKNDIKSVQFDQLQSKFDSAMETDLTRPELIDLISEFNDAIKLGRETTGSRSQMRVQLLENMKLSLLRGIR